MQELSIVFGLLIFFVVIAVYDQRESGRSCDEYSRYYDKMYYQLPKLETVDSSSGDLNNKTADTVTRKQVTKDTSKPVEAMWESKPSHERGSRAEVSDEKTINQVMGRAAATANNAVTKSNSQWSTQAS
jgi:hypothetical protein